MFKTKKYVQGLYRPVNPEKYKGNVRHIVFRSSLELKAFRYLDNNPNVICWASERVVVPYQSPLDGKVHRYFTDLVAHLKDPTTNEIKKLLIEIKPHKQTLRPVSTNRKAVKTLMVEQRMYAVNQAKWKAAEEWSARNGYRFIVMTDKHLTKA